MTRKVRLFIAPALILAWLAVAVVGAPYFGRTGEVASDDPISFLPANSESTRVARSIGDFAGGEKTAAVVLVIREAGLTDQDRAWVAGLPQRISKRLPAAGAVPPPAASKDGKAMQIYVMIPASGDLAADVRGLDDELGTSRPDGLQTYVTGPAGLSAALVDAFGGIDGMLLLVALGVVFVILLVVYRSVFLPVIVLITAATALTGAVLVDFYLAKAGVITTNRQVQGILFILVIGAATDYSLLLVARLREEYQRRESSTTALLAALRGVVEPVCASGGTVAAGVLCLLVSDLASNNALGPVAAIGIVFSVVAALTLLPAILLLMGRAAFWPRRPLYTPAWQPPEGGFWARTADFVDHRARLVLLVLCPVFALACLGMLGLKADGVPQSELVLGANQARDGQHLIAEHFPGGSGSPAVLLVPKEGLPRAGALITSDSGIDSAVVVSHESPAGALPLPLRGEGKPLVRDGHVLVQATLRDAADSSAAEETIHRLRTSLHDAAPGTLIGGATAINMDMAATGEHDRAMVIPLVLLVITLILGLLLRAIVAPLVLAATTVLSFGAALGLSSLVFNHVFDFPGADPGVPLYAFVFLVALGVDYNIFLVARTREEALRSGTRKGIRQSLVVTGGVITSAGVVLAATFAALGVVPLIFLAQLAFMVALGVVLDTFVVRAFLVPALVRELGRRFWWPASLRD